MIHLGEEKPGYKNNKLKDMIYFALMLWCSKIRFSPSGLDRYSTQSSLNTFHLNITFQIDFSHPHSVCWNSLWPAHSPATGGAGGGGHRSICGGIVVFYILRIWYLSFCFQVKIRGHPDDFNEPDNQKETAAVRNNGFNPTWKEAFVFNLKVPEVALLDLKVKITHSLVWINIFQTTNYLQCYMQSYWRQINEYLVFSSCRWRTTATPARTSTSAPMPSGSWICKRVGKYFISFLGNIKSSIPVPGYRRAYLLDYTGAELKPAALFVKINKRWIKQGIWIWL